MSTPTTTTRTLTTDLAGPITLHVNAETLHLHVDADAGVTQPTAEITGPGEVVDQVRADTDGTRWSITVPAGEPTAISGGGRGTIVQLGDTGAIHVGGGTTVVNGAVITGGITGTVRSTHGPSGSTTVITGDAAADLVQARVRLPEYSSVRSRATSGAVHTTGHLDAVDHEGDNADVQVAAAGEVTVDTHNGDVSLGTVTGEAGVDTHNGNIGLATTGTRSSLSTHNGQIDVTAGSQGPITARSHNGNVTVRRNGWDPRVRTRTHNGTERVL